MRSARSPRACAPAPGRSRWLLLPLLVVLASPPAIAQRALGRPVLHEPIPPDPAEDMALSLALDGDLPAAIQTPRGLVSAPDPARPVGTGDAPYGATPKGDASGATFRPDRDTRRPELLPYDDPFSPSTAPFKRLAAYDSVGVDYTLSVKDPRTTPLAVSSSPPPATSEEHFFADMVVDLSPGEKVRIPSVGPGARVLRARAGVGAEDVAISLYKDGADNWFVEGTSARRARLVMELSIPRATFGGSFGSPTRAELPPVAPLPANVQAAAAEVARKLGLSTRAPPREIVSKLVAWFRSFQESAEPLAGGGDIYLDLALQKKGVCRHRAFAFLVTSLYLGVPARVITNEAHAWVEVYDGQLWRRIDLGGAGSTLRDPLSMNVPYAPPPDPFSWPNSAGRGDDLAERARRAPTASSGAPGTLGSSGAPGPRAAGTSSASTSAGNDRSRPDGTGSGAGPPHGEGGGAGAAPTAPPAPDDRPASIVQMVLSGTDAHRGAPLAVRGDVSAAGEPCKHVPVEIWFRSRTRGDVRVGVLATDDHGRYGGALVLPLSLPLGDYEASARTPGDARCGRGQTR